jgi:hypothetical protein
MEMSKICENFSWLGDVQNIVFDPKQPNIVRLKYTWAKAGEISLNRRLYVASELEKCARTFIGKAVNVNHSDAQKIGRIVWSEYDTADGKGEGVAEISKEPYVTLLRTHSPEVKGVSLQSLFLFCECSRCGKKFDSEQKLRQHLKDDEFLNDSAVNVPRGMVSGDPCGLALVVGDEQPGCQTKIELMESKHRGLNEMCETYLKEKKISVEPESVATSQSAQAQPIFLDPITETSKLAEEKKKIMPATENLSAFSNPKPEPKLQENITDLNLIQNVTKEPKDMVSPAHKHTENTDRIRDGHTDLLRQPNDKPLGDKTADVTNQQIKEKISLIEQAPEPFKTAFFDLIKIADNTVIATQNNHKAAESKNAELAALIAERDAEITRLKAADQTEILTRTIADLQQQITAATEEKTKTAANMQETVDKRENTLREALEANKKIAETNTRLEKELSETQKALTVAENKIDKWKGSFKGKAEPFKQTITQPIMTDPITNR